MHRPAAGSALHRATDRPTVQISLNKVMRGMRSWTLKLELLLHDVLRFLLRDSTIVVQVRGIAKNALWSSRRRLGHLHEVKTIHDVYGGNLRTSRDRNVRVEANC